MWGTGRGLFQSEPPACVLLTYQARCVFAITEITECFLTGFDVCSTGANTHLDKNSGGEVMNPSGEAAAVVLLNGHGVPVICLLNICV